MKILYKTIRDITTEKTSKPSNTIPVYEISVDVSLSNKWSSVALRRPYNKNKARNSDIYHITQPIEHANKYTMLSNPQEMSICHEGNGVTKITK